MARTWLADCCDSHEKCRNKKVYRPPTRLISIEHEVVRLVVTETLESPPQYATLSYCWGQQPFTKLTRDNYESFQVRIPQNGLPRTFTDAFEVARQLGIRYIWIDALCIIQDDDPNATNNDWAKEAGYMSSVYGGACVSIAATTATSPHQGFLQAPENHEGFVAEVTQDGCRKLRNFYRPRAFSEATSKSHLAGRAWTFQERILPARTIYFGDNGLFWGCRSLRCAESAPDGDSGDDDFSKYFSGTNLEDKPWRWDRIVSDYSVCQLTYPSIDKLPALSGIAARQGGITGDQYLAGLWRNSLETRLCWLVEGLVHRRPEWRAPTWSWASIDGRVSYTPFAREVKDSDLLIRVDDARIILADPNLPYGNVRKGELTLSCSHLFRGHLCTGNVDSMYWED